MLMRKFESLPSFFGQFCLHGLFKVTALSLPPLLQSDVSYVVICIEIYINFCTQYKYETEIHRYKIYFR